MWVGAWCLCPFGVDVCGVLVYQCFGVKLLGVGFGVFVFLFGFPKKRIVAYLFFNFPLTDGCAPGVGVPLV